MSLDQVKSDIDRIINSFSRRPWVLQENIFNKINLKNKEYLIDLNKIIRESEKLQILITKNSAAKKYWNTAQAQALDRTISKNNGRSKNNGD